jgi:hypothetical protein
MSDPQAEISTAGVIIADKTEIASGKLVIGIAPGTRDDVDSRAGKLVRTGESCSAGDASRGSAQSIPRRNPSREARFERYSTDTKKHVRHSHESFPQ